MKLFSHSYLNNFDILKNALIGFEFEFFPKSNYPITLEVLNRKLYPIRIEGFKQYHSKFEPTADTWKIEPDLSLGFQGCELVTGPMPYADAKVYLTKTLRIIQEIGYTNDRSSIHINLSFTGDKNIDKLNIIKFILNIEENKIYDLFPERKNNIYAKSIKNILPYKDFDYTSASASILNNSLVLPSTKYFGVNFSKINEGRLEIRYLGGENYHMKVNEILDMLDYFIMLTYNSIEYLNEDEMKLLKSYLDTNIKKYKNLSKYDNFLTQFPSIELQIDRKTTYEAVNTYYPHIYSEIFDFLKSFKTIEDVIINYDTESKKIEIYGGKISFINSVKELDFIECEIINGDFSYGEFIRCEMKDSTLKNLLIKDCKITKSKLDTCRIDQDSHLKECIFMDGYIDCEMDGGVFRSGKKGPNAKISDTTKIMNDESNFFNLNIKEITTDKKGKK